MSIKRTEIYPIEESAKKISRLLSEVESTKPNMYAKTKVRYRELAKSLLDSVNKISNILAEEILAGDNTSGGDEFNELTDNTAFYSLDTSLQEAQYHISTKDSLSSNYSSTLDEDNITLPLNTNQSNSDTNISIHKTLDYFDSIFSDASIYDFGYKEVNNCAKSLYTWYHSRFIDHRDDPEFKFSIKYLPKWISEFIIVYGYQYDCSNSEHFISEIQKWSSSLYSKNSKYAIPYSIYEFEHSESPPESYTIASLVINDILMEEILYKLSKPECPNLAVNLDCNDVTNIIQQNNDSLLAIIRTRLTHQSELIEQLGFTKTVGHIDE